MSYPREDKMDFYKKLKLKTIKELSVTLNSICRFLMVVLIFIHVFHLKKDDNIVPLLQKIAVNTDLQKTELSFLAAN